MQTRKDLLQAHRLMTQRAALALVLGQPDNPELPLRRINVATFCGVMVAVLVMAGFGIYGLMRPGGATGLQKAGMLIVEKETGARYVWCQNDRLCPVANYVSARLLAGSDAQSRRNVSRNSLTKFQRGPLIGIPGAPDTLPDAKQLVKLPWSACVRTVEAGGAGRTSMVTLVAGASVGGQPLRDDQAVVVQADQQAWLLWKNQRLRVPAYAVGTLTPDAAQVSGKWLNTLLPGPDFQAPAIPGRGSATAGPQGTKAGIGQIFTSDAGSGAAWYVLLRDGLAPISALEKDLLRADPATRKAYGSRPVEPISLDPATANAAPKSAATISNAALKGQMPQVLQYNDGVPLCATYADRSGADPGRLTVGATLGEASTTVAAAGADQFVFPPGGAALAGLLPGPGKAVSTYFLVTEGHRYALKSAEVATALGYDQSADAVPVPAGLLSLIPAGPTLDPDMARYPVPTIPSN